MENASKALIMAGAILIAIMIISLGVLVFNKMGNSAKEAANMDKQEISAFNSKITPYIGNKISGSQVNALIQYIISINTAAVNSGDVTKSVSITYPLDAGVTNTIKVEGGAVVGTNNVKRVQTGSSSYYKVEETYGSNGLINTITVTQ